MAWLATAVELFAALICMGWLLISALGLVSFLKLRSLRDLPPEPHTSWPKLSVIVPALNEESTIEAAAKTLLGASYPNLEVVLIDDRSTDTTGAIIDRLASQDARVRAIHIQSLPEGWLGKTHALHSGVAGATGEIILFTDADVHFQPGALEHAVALVEREELGHLTVFPNILSRGFWLRSVIVSFGASFVLLVQPHRVGQPGSKAFAGVGAFNMVTKNAFEKTPGFPWLQMEIADDVGLGLMMSQSGAKSACIFGTGLLSIEWYPSIGALIAGLEKNLYGVFTHYSVLNFFFRTSIVAALWAGLVTALASSTPWLFGLGITTVLAILIIHVYGALRAELGVLEGLFAPVVGGGILMLALARSTLAFWRNDGCRWRGTYYSADALRAGQRVKV